VPAPIYYESSRHLGACARHLGAAAARRCGVRVAWPCRRAGPALLFSCTPQQSQRRKRVYSREAAPPRPCSRPAVHGVRSRVFDAFSQLFDRAACAALRTCGPLLRPTYSLILEQCALCSGQCPCGRSGQWPLGTGRLGARGASPGHDIKVPWLEQCMLGGWFSYRVRHEDRLQGSESSSSFPRFSGWPGATMVHMHRLP
jgi:hypothetical protein